VRGEEENGKRFWELEYLFLIKEGRNKEEVRREKKSYWR
jgi:hypothetical protein